MSASIAAAQTTDYFWPAGDLTEGVKLFESPSLKATILDTIPTGYSFDSPKRLTEPATRLNLVPDCPVNFNGCRLTGKFMEVDYDGKMGYVFDGHRSRLKPPPKGYHDYFVFFEQNFDLIDSALVREENGDYYYRFTFEGGIVVQEWHSYGGRSHKINMLLPGFQPNETLLFLNHFEGIQGLMKTEQTNALETAYFWGGTPYFSESLVTMIYSGSWINVLISRDWE